MTGALKKRVLRSGSWVIVGHLFSQGLRLGGNLILTRLLVPEMFGVMAIVTMVIWGLTMFSDVGLLQNIVQSKRGEEADFLNTAWTIQLIRGGVIFLITLTLSYGLYYAGQTGFLSPETVYGNDELPLILAVMSVTALISGFNSIHLLILNRKLKMGKLVFIELLSQLFGLIFMLAWAVYKRDIWALVLGSIFSVVMKMLLSHALNIGGRCRFRWERDAVYEIFHFGKWIFLSSIFGFLLNQGDRVLLGGLISPEMLGVYTIAFFLANALKDVMLKLSASVFFPLLSETVRNAPENLQNIYYKIRHKIDAISFFVAGFVFAAGDVLIKVLYDSRYHEAGWMLQVLSLSLVATGYFLSGECFLAHGKAKIVSVITLIQTLSFYLILPFLFFKYGMPGAVWAIVIVSVLRIFISSVFMKVYIFYNFKKEVLMVPVILFGFLLGEIIRFVII